MTAINVKFPNPTNLIKPTAKSIEANHINMRAFSQNCAVKILKNKLKIN